MALSKCFPTFGKSAATGSDRRKTLKSRVSIQTPLKNKLHTQGIIKYSIHETQARTAPIERAYRFTIKGLSEANGEITAVHLQRVISALLKTTERATRLLATGESTAPGKRPAWLGETIDFRITGITKGSTVLNIAAPCIGDTAPEQFSQQEFWRESPNMTHTALDLVAAALAEARDKQGTGDRYDEGTLSAIDDLRKSIGGVDVRFQLESLDGKTPSFQLDRTAFEEIRERKRDLPEPRAFVVTGKLDEIRHSAGRFRLFMANGARMLGRVHPEYLSAESLRTYWGKEVTIEGLVHFKANGDARLIDARKLLEHRAGDEVFDVSPQVHPERQKELFPELVHEKGRKGDPMSFWGAWPGDEPIEELLAELGD